MEKFYDDLIIIKLYSSDLQFLQRFYCPYVLKNVFGQENNLLKKLTFTDFAQNKISLSKACSAI